MSGPGRVATRRSVDQGRLGLVRCCHAEGRSLRQPLLRPDISHKTLKFVHKTSSMCEGLANRKPHPIWLFRAIARVPRERDNPAKPSLNSRSPLEVVFVT